MSGRNYGFLTFGLEKQMNILITGVSGLIGSKLKAFLIEKGHTVIPFRLRSASTENELTQVLNTQTIEAVIHLAGESVASRWTKDKMDKIKNSRLNGTKILCQALANTNQRPKVLIGASAIGYYGSRGNETLDEKSTKGTGFLADLAQQWELVENEAIALGIRVVNLRIGIVLSKDGGALAKMLLPFKMGAGGEIGDGQQYMSWVDINDVIGAIYHILNNPSLTGPVNTVAPYPVTNKEFTKTLGKVLNRPTLIPVPSFALRTLFGTMADELLLSGQKVMPSKLHASDYKFEYGNLESSLKHVLNKN
jgi:uncharacterized protein (TIGR01777 family)